MTPVRLAPPEPVDLVPAEEVSELIAATDRDLAEMELRVEQARGAADEAEGWLRESGVDEQASTWTLVRLQRFVTELREEAHRDANDVIELATHRAALRHSEAQAEIARHRSEPAIGRDTATPFGAVPYRVPVPQVHEFVAPAVEPAIAADPPQEPVLVAAPVAPITVVPFPGPAVEEADETPEVVPVLLAPPEPAVHAAVEPDHDHDGAHTGDFWQPEVEAATRRRRFRLPLSAILEVAAVVLILVFILLRLS